MYNIWRRVLNFLKDPLGVGKVVQHINLRASELQGDIYHVHLRTSELMKALNNFESRMQEYNFLRAVRDAVDSMMPDMMWAKDTKGRYIIANKAIRDRLLKHDNPYGKTDVELANRIKEMVGEDNHTFGEVCGDSDGVVLKHDMPMRFNEDGLIDGEYVMLQVHKNTLKDAEGNVLGTVGIGRDITYEVKVLRRIAEETTCSDTRDRIITLLKEFEYRGENVN